MVVALIAKIRDQAIQLLYLFWISSASAQNDAAFLRGCQRLPGGQHTDDEVTR
jgi:hypothetical protein